MYTSISLKSFPLTFPLTASLTAVVAKLRATLARHMKTTFCPDDDMAAFRAVLPALFGSQFLNFLCFLVLRTKLARVCF